MKRALLIIACILAVLVSGCVDRMQKNGQGNGSAAESGESLPESAGLHRSGWYYFSDRGIHAAQSPSSIPSRPFAPWTEAVRVADMANVEGKPSFLINRLGVMSGPSETEAATLHSDAPILQSVTAGGFIQFDGNTGIRVYRNSFFAEGSKPGENPFLLHFAGPSERYSPWIKNADMGVSAGAQCVSLDRIGSMWYAAFKSENKGRVEFTYLEFENFPSPGTEERDLSGIRKIDADSYRTAITPFPYSGIPERIAGLLSGIAPEIPIQLHVYSVARQTVQVWIREGTGAALEGKAITSGEKTAILFPDGTFYLDMGNGSAKPLVLRLPALSAGYVYTYFILSGDKLISAWEEQRFFETGRAGLLEISLPDGIYWKEE